MQLRSSNHFHFIQAIKGGSVVKLLNMDNHGQPALKFKEVKQIYNLRDDKCVNQVPAVNLRDDLQNSPTKLDIESPRVKTVKSEPEAFDFNCNNDGGETNNEHDDLSLGNMTLKQIKNACKMKKRKRLNSVILKEEAMETCSSVKHDVPSLQSKDDEYDLEEPLISWTSKLSKKVKSRGKCLRKTISASSPFAFSISKSEQSHSDEDFLEPNVDCPVPIGVKVEVPELAYSECHTMFNFTTNSDFSYNEQADSMATVSSEPETINVRFLEPESPYRAEVPQFCSLNEVSYEYSEYLETKSDVGVSGWEIVKVDSPEILSYEYSDFSEYNKENYIINSIPYDVSPEQMFPTKDYNCQSNSPNKEMSWQTSSYTLIQVPKIAIACGLETKDSSYPIEEPLCSIPNGDSLEYKENGDPNFGASFSGREIVKVDSPEIIPYQVSDLKEFVREDSTFYFLPYDVSSEPLSPPKDDCPDLHDSFRSNSSEQKKAWQTNNYDQVEVDVDSDDSLQCLVKLNGGNAYSFESRSAHGLPSNNGKFGISLSSDSDLYLRSLCLNPDTDLAPSGKQSLLPAYRATNPFDVSNEPMGSLEPQDYQKNKQKHHPERLLSSRKAISPTSQEKLCRAMELTGLNDDKHLQCRGKLYFGNQTNHRILKAQGLDQLRRDGSNIRPKSIMRKANADKKVSPIKSNLKVTTASTVQRCSQSAIAFSQRQMRDIESLATKLTTELKSMRDIAMGNLQFEDSTATAVNENANEIKMAVENATRAEETARKWLSIMARDCNRFCKIMRLTEDGKTAASAPTIHKGRKITFADETGGKLCHVKFFKNDMSSASSLECGNEKQSLLV